MTYSYIKNKLEKRNENNKKIFFVESAHEGALIVYEFIFSR